METVKNLQKWKNENGLFGRADICYGYSTKDFDEYIKANNVPCVLVKQETSGQICRFYEKEQKEIIVAYLKEKKEERLNCLNVETVGYMTIKQVAKVLNVSENTILNLKNKTDLFADNKTLKTENNRPCLFIRFNDAIENRCRQFLIEHKIKTLNEDLKLRYDRKKIFQLRLGEVFDVESEWFEKMWELVEKYQTGDFIKKEGWHNHHIIPRFYFAENYLELDNSELNLVYLPATKHLEIHCYGYMASNEHYKDKLLTACCVLNKAMFADKNTTAEEKERVYDIYKECIADKNNVENKSSTKRKISNCIESRIKEMNLNLGLFFQKSGFSKSVYDKIINCEDYSINELLVLLNAIGLPLFKIAIM
jgi:hypothetical protein